MKRAGSSPPAVIGAVVAAAEGKQGREIRVLDLRQVASFCDYFVLMSGGSVRQVQALADAIISRLDAEGIPIGHVEGYVQGEWILIDGVDFVVHVFLPEKRAQYDLERLWSDAEVVDLEADSA